MDLIVLIGLQASGKSTFYQRMLSSTHTLVSKDLLRNNRRPERRQQELIREALDRGESVVVDNTNAGKKERQQLIAIAQDFKISCIGYYFQASVKQSLERNAQREGKARVPDIAIFATLKRLEHPSYDEGFTELYYVTPQPEHLFLISPWKAEE